MIILGIASTFLVYQLDIGSLDFVRMEHATDFAILHATLWSAVGTGVILWYGVGPGSDEGQGPDQPSELS